MTQTNHTPGPWTAEHSNYGDEIWFGGYGAGMWTVEPIGAYLDGASKENARLIAAAPDMLAALVEAADALNDSGEYPLTLRRIRAAIAKAKGE